MVVGSNPVAIDLLHDLPFYDELSVAEISKAFKEYTGSYKTEIIDSKDLLAQLEASKSSTENLFKDFLNEMKGFKYQIIVNVLLNKYRGNGDKKFAPVYLNSATKTVINPEYNLDKCFQEMLYRIDNWINEGSGWIIESTEAEYVNISIYSPLSGSTYVELPHKFKNSVKDLVNFKNNGNKCFLWCHIRHLNPLKTHLERITKADKKMINDLNYKGIKFPVSKNDFSKIEQEINICINLFCYENELTYPVYESDQKFKNCIDLLMISDKNKLRYVYFSKFMCNKTKNKNKKYF